MANFNFVLDGKELLYKTFLRTNHVAVALFCKQTILPWIYETFRFEASFGNILSKQVPTVNNRIDSRVQSKWF